MRNKYKTIAFSRLQDYFTTFKTSRLLHYFQDFKTIMTRAKHMHHRYSTCCRCCTTVLL